ncbi:hypothetical protein BaRGS_00021307 [Batillaria attramentaria]|uniref:Uncharacterized protein n=1 Tax=Batillaria attramentaria TaxID=370345 RepID=A0ABD0KJS4_9CAEN
MHLYLILSLENEVPLSLPFLRKLRHHVTGSDVMLQVMSRTAVRPAPLNPVLLTLTSTVVVLLVLAMVVPTPTTALCEDRCSMAQPQLWTRLRALWSRSFKRVGEKRE